MGFLKQTAPFWLPPLLKGFLLSVGATCRVTWLGQDQIQSLELARQPWIYSMWHNNIATACWLLRHTHLTAMVSQSFDGDLIAAAMHKMGYGTVRGSSSKGGAKALISMIKLIKEGKAVAITPDGPRGPLYQMQPGGLLLAQKTGAALVPFHLQSDKALVFQSWDRHHLPKPFARVVASYGQPFFVPPGLDEAQMAQLQEDFQQAMMDNVRKVEQELQRFKDQA